MKPLVGRFAPATRCADRVGHVDGELRLLVLPDASTCALLELAEPEPLLRIESLAYSASGRPLEHCRALHRCKASRLHVKTTT